MKRYMITGLITLSLLGLSGCALGDKIEQAAKDLYEKAKEKYKEYRGEGEENQPRPFDPIFQNANGPKTPIISSACNYNAGVRYVYFSNQTEASNNFFNATRSLVSSPASLKPFWDIRYVNPVNAFVNGTPKTFYPDYGQYSGLDARSGINNLVVGTAYAQTDPTGTVIQSECVNGHVAGSAAINLYDAPEQALIYAGPQSTYAYSFDTSSHISPWRTDGTGNLALQASFDKPIYVNYGGNIGGGVYFNVFIRNRLNGMHLNFVIGLYAAGDAWIVEKRGIQFDPTTNIVHVATVASDESWWSTLSPQSRGILEIVSTPDAKNPDNGQWGEFYRVNISYQNLFVVLQELQKSPPAGAAGMQFGLNPADWEVTSLMVQYELSEKGGKARLSGSFSGFEVYTSPYPF